MNIIVHNTTKSELIENSGYESYWALSEHQAMMYWHIRLALFAWAGILPIAVMLSISHSRFSLPSQFVFLMVNRLALSVGYFYNKRAPNLYNNNVHGRIGWIITCTAITWVIIALIKAYVSRHGTLEYKSAGSTTAISSTQYHQVEDGESFDTRTWSDNHRQGSTLLSRSLDDYHVSFSLDIADRHLSRLDASTSQDTTRASFVTRYFPCYVACFAMIISASSLRLFYVILERIVLLQGSIAVLSDTVVYRVNSLQRDNEIFNVLAHYIKGSVFFLYGLLTLGR
ncbi:hypothetical protein HBI79_149080 [Parastagonospora nodorum]|nr:hypothetical protein HBI79_149080 [Parastagonospora nodorum]